MKRPRWIGRGRWRRRIAEGPRDRGTAGMYVVLFTPAVFLLAGLLVDGGLAIHARQRAADMAEQAARAGANEIDADILRRTGEPVIAPDRARVAACDLLTDYGTEVTGSDCAADEDQVVVTVELTVRLQLLGIVPGMSEFTMRSTASAEPVTAEDQ